MRIFWFILILLVYNSIVFSKEMAAGYSLDSEVDDGQTKLSVQLHSHKFVDINKSYSPLNFKEIHIEGLKYRKEKGRPKVPEFSVLFESNKELLNDIKISKSNRELINGVNIAPYEGAKCRCRDNEIFIFNKEVYEEPMESTKIDYFGDLKGRQIFRLSFSPVEVQEEDVHIWKRFEIVFPKGAKLINTKNLIYNSFSNFSEKKKMLIISSEKFKEELIRFTNLKEKLGVDTKVVMVSDIGNTTEQIKKYIKDYYLSLDKKLDFVIMVGTEEEIATHYVETKFTESTPSDLAYYLLGSEEDIIPDVFGARISVESVKDLKVIIDKNIDFYDNSTKGNLVGIASNEGFNPSDEEYVKEMMGPLEKIFSKSANYLLQNNEDSNSDTFNSYLSSGSSWVNYIGHGNGYSWPSFYQAYNTDDITDITPSKTRPIIIDVACQNGRFDNTGRLGETMMHASVRGEGVGSVAYFGGSVDISWDPPAIMAVGINKSVASKSFSYLGEVLLEGHLYLIKNHSDKEDIRDNLEWYHLQGDPSLLLSQIY